jgi:large subunit ribosomal protein L35
MPKMKTHSRAKKTFKVTGTGKVTYRKAGRGHLLTKKATSRKRGLRVGGTVSSANMNLVSRMLCI